MYLLYSGTHMWDSGTCAQTPGWPVLTFPLMLRKNGPLCSRLFISFHFYLKKIILVNESSCHFSLYSYRSAPATWRRTRRRSPLILSPCQRSETWTLPMTPTRFWSRLCVYWVSAISQQQMNAGNVILTRGLWMCKGLVTLAFIVWSQWTFSLHISKNRSIVNSMHS